MTDTRYSIIEYPSGWQLNFHGQPIGEPHRFKRQAIAARVEHNRLRLYAAAA